MDRLLASIETLDANVGSLRSSLEPIGQIADRMLGDRRWRRRLKTEPESSCEVLPYG